MTIAPWAFNVLACPRCGAGLTGKPRKGSTSWVLRCGDCGPYPVLAGVPILVPEPALWCATFHDAALSALAEADLASREAVHTLRAFAEAAPGAEPSRFSDDWTRAEALGSEAPALTQGPGTDALHELQRVAELQSPGLWLEHRAPQGVVLEVGCGAGSTSELLASKRRKLLVGDLSLRSVLHAARRSSGVPLVLDAQALPIGARALDALVAEHVVDLLDDPEAFFTSAKVALAPTGRLLVATPAPALSAPDGDESALQRLALTGGFSTEDSADGLPWLRVNTARFVEVYLVQVLALRHQEKKRRRD